MANHENIIMLSHDVYPETAEALEQILDLFPEYSMEVITDGAKPVQF